MTTGRINQVAKKRWRDRVGVQDEWVHALELVKKGGLVRQKQWSLQKPNAPEHHQNRTKSMTSTGALHSEKGSQHKLH